MKSLREDIFTDIWEIFLQKWDSAHEIRHQSICDLADKTVAAVLQTWPAYTHPQGPLLVLRDFDALKLTSPELSDAYLNFKDFFDRICNICMKRNESDKRLDDLTNSYIQLLESDSTEGNFSLLLIGQIDDLNKI